MNIVTYGIRWSYEQQRLTVQNRQLHTISMSLECPSCGHDNRDEANYCLKCGISLIGPREHMVEARAELSASSLCSFHPDAVATYICGRCGRLLCRLCVRPYFEIVLCPLCSIGPVQPHPWYPQPTRMPMHQMARQTWPVW